MNYKYAALWGTTVDYTEYSETVSIERADGKMLVMESWVFEDLFYKLNEFTAALVEDCIEFSFCDCGCHSVTLRNRFGETRLMELETFRKYYNDLEGDEDYE